MKIQLSILQTLEQQLALLVQEIQTTENKWQQELDLVQQIQRLNSQTKPEHQAAIAALRTDLAQLQGQTPLVFERVNAQIINEIISDWTGIPVGKMLNDED